MKRFQPPSEPRPGGGLSIGALSRATGIPVETLRTWEGRYGFPVPERKRSGHRIYPLAAIPHLQLTAEALKRGHRAGEVVGASEAALRALLSATGSAAPSAPPTPPNRTGATGNSLTSAMGLLRSYDWAGFRHELEAQWIARSPLAFLDEYLSPLAHAVGEAWAAGELSVRHEHFFTEAVGDFLRAVRQPYDAHAHGPFAVLATLEGEAHTLGLQMCALVLAMGGYRVLYLGAQVPLADIVQASAEQAAPLVGLSVAPSATLRPAAALKQLRARLPGGVTVLVGGAGAPALGSGFQVMRDLGQLAHWTRAAS